MNEVDRALRIRKSPVWDYVKADPQVSVIAESYDKLEALFPGAEREEYPELKSIPGESNKTSGSSTFKTASSLKGKRLTTNNEVDMGIKSLLKARLREQIIALAKRNEEARRYVIYTQNLRANNLFKCDNMRCQAVLVNQFLVGCCPRLSSYTYENGRAAKKICPFCAGTEKVDWSHLCSCGGFREERKHYLTKEWNLWSIQDAERAGELIIACLNKLKL